MSGVKGKSGGHNRISDRERAINGESHKNRNKGTGNNPLAIPGVIEHAEFGKLGEAGQKFFNMLSPMLIANGTMSCTDSFAFYLLCDAYDYFETMKKLALEGGIVLTGKMKDGKPIIIKRSELMRDYQDARRQVISQLKDFGIDPESRNRIVKIASGEEDDEIESIT